MRKLSISFHGDDTITDFLTLQLNDKISCKILLLKKNKYLCNK